MAEISKIKFPSGNVYDIKDAYARQLLAGGLQFVVCWDGNSTPVVANIPAGVVVTYNDVEYTGTKAASTAEPLTFYLVKEVNNVYSEYVSIRSGAGTELDPYVYAWEKLGDTSIDLSNLGALAYKDNVTLSKGSGANVLGANATFSAASSAVSFGAHTTDKVLGSDATFSASVTPSTEKYDVDTTDADFVTAYAGASGKLATTSIKGVAGTENATLVSNKSSKKLVTTAIPNVTNAGAASTWNFAMGSGDDSETLIISGANGSAPTLGTAITAATGQLAATSESSNVGATIVESFDTSDKTLATAEASAITVATGSIAAADASSNVGDSVMTGLGTKSTAKALTAAALAADASGVQLVTGISAASVSVSSKDEVTAITALGAATAAAQTISVASADSKKVAEYDDLGVSVS